MEKAQQKLDFFDSLRRDREATSFFSQFYFFISGAPVCQAWPTFWPMA